MWPVGGAIFQTSVMDTPKFVCISIDESISCLIHDVFAYGTFSLCLLLDRATCYGEDALILMLLDIMGHICLHEDIVFKDLNQEHGGYWFWFGSKMMC
jgi:hypothetical protein